MPIDKDITQNVEKRNEQLDIDKDYFEDENDQDARSLDDISI